MATAVLVVDDSTSIRRMVESALRYKGYAVVTAVDGQEALEVLEHGTPSDIMPDEAGGEPFDLVVLDINMPRMDGLSALTAIRERADWANLPVLMLTTEGQDSDRARALALGATDYIVKPFKPNELLSCVAALVSTSG